MNPLRSLGLEVAEQQDERDARSGASSADLERARAGFLEATQGPAGRAPQASKQLPRALWLVAAVSTTLVAFFFLLPKKQLACEVVTLGQACHVGSLIRANPAQVPLRFSEGTTVLLEPGAEAQVAELTAHGAHIHLATGRSVVSVSHLAGAIWEFSAGPFRVQVTGTRFELEWNADKQRFVLAMQDGSVRVTGPTLGDGRTLIAGQRLVVELGRDGGALDAALAPSSAPDPSGNDAGFTGADAAAQADPQAEAGSGAKQPSHEATTLTWQALARKGEYKLAVETAERDGIDGVLNSVGGADLLLLGDSARYAGRGNLARLAYLTARKRFPGSSSAAMAAFSLGRFGGGESLAWFQRYLAEQPNGTLAREALGRVLELQNTGAGSAAALATAKNYLARFPTGPHAPLARAVIKRDAASGERPDAVISDAGAAPSPAAAASHSAAQPPGANPPPPATPTP